MQTIETYLPTGVTYQTFDTEIMLLGPSLDQDQFDEIIQTLSPELRQQVIGWRRITVR